MVEALKEFFNNYANFNGRTSRKTFWLTVLGIFIVSFVVGFVAGFIGGVINNAMITTVITSIYYLAVLVPSLAIDIRRLHDINKSGWWLLICFVPFVGSIILLVFMCLPSVDEGNNY
ncbi:MAG: DUF805 domain-containing protein [Bacilli bacterium]|nr:DUF805 domain-containing protein [Bacilli bacterium]MBR6949765.1 DUF805 domain-containing protein [Bacilli bacterium]